MFDGLRTNSRLGWVVGILAAGIAVVGYTVFGWRFGETGGLSSMIGVAVAGVAVGFLAYEAVS